MLQVEGLGQPGAGLWTEGTCSMGNDTICRQHGAEYACVGCDFPELAAIKQLQATLNTAAGVLGISYRVDVDGQVGQRTTYLVGLVGSKMSAMVPQPPAVEAAVGVATTSCGTTGSCTQLAMRQVAVTVPALTAYFARAPEAVGKPPGTDLPVPGQPPSLPGVALPPRSKTIVAGFLGGLTFLAAGIGIGFATRAQKRKRP